MMKKIVASLLLLFSVNAVAVGVASDDHSATVVATSVGTQMKSPLSILLYRGVSLRGYVVPGRGQSDFAFIGYIANTKNSKLQARTLTAAEAVSANAIYSKVRFNNVKADKEVTFVYLDLATVGGTGLDVGAGWRFTFAGDTYWYNPTSVSVIKLTPAQVQLLSTLPGGKA